MYALLLTGLFSSVVSTYIAIFWYIINLFLSIELFCPKHLSWLEATLSPFMHHKYLLNIYCILGIGLVLEESKLIKKRPPPSRSSQFNMEGSHLTKLRRHMKLYVDREALSRNRRKWVWWSLYVWFCLTYHIWETAESFTLLRNLTCIQSGRRKKA